MHSTRSGPTQIHFPNTEKYGEMPQSAMVITDKQGDIVAYRRRSR